MTLTITREEVENLVREKYTLPEDIKILIKETDTHSIAPLKVTVNKENQVQDIVEESLTQKVRKTRGKVLHKYPAKLSKEELDKIYEGYADIVEEFIKSGKDEQFIECEDRAPSTMRYRYNTAIKMYGFDDQVYASATEHGGTGHAKLIRKVQK